MKTIDMHGKSINEVIAAFRKEHRIKDWELKYEVLSKPSNGFLGLIGKKPATIRFSLPSLEEKVKLFMEQLMAQMGISYENIKTYTEQKTIYVTILKPGDAGFLIGKNGYMLEQLQYLVNRVFENVQYLERIYIDTEDYRYRQDMNFLKPFIPLINKVKTTGKALTLEPMQPGERRIIHQFVERDRAIKTMTIGEGEKKRIVIMPSSQASAEPRKPLVENRNKATDNRKPASDNRKPASEHKKPSTDTKRPQPEARKPLPELKKNMETKRPPVVRPPRETSPEPRKPVAESKKPAGELTPEQRASQALKRHNQAHHHTPSPQRPRKPERPSED